MFARVSRLQTTSGDILNKTIKHIQRERAATFERRFLCVTSSLPQHLHPVPPALPCARISRAGQQVRGKTHNLLKFYGGEGGPFTPFHHRTIT